MKVLFLTQPQPDYLADAVFHGMVTLLGTDAVRHFPAKKSYCGRIDGIPGLLQSLCFNYPETAQIDGYPDWTQYDLILADVTSGMIHERDPARRALYEEAGREAPLFLLDGCDHGELIPHDEKWCRLYLKREYQAGTHSRWDDCRPLSFAWVSELLVPPWRPRDFALSFCGTDTNGLRNTFVEALRCRQDARILCSLTSRPHWPVAREEYLRILMMSRAALSLPGVGCDTYRYWEIPATGACLISPRLPITITRNFTHLENAFFLDGVADLEEQMEWLLTEDAAMSEIAYQGFLHLRAHHTSRHRAQQVLDYFEEDSRFIAVKDPS